MKKLMFSLAIFAFAGIGAASAQTCPHAAKAQATAVSSETTTTAVNDVKEAKCTKGAEGKACCANKAASGKACCASKGTASTSASAVAVPVASEVPAEKIANKSCAKAADGKSCCKSKTAGATCTKGSATTAAAPAEKKDMVSDKVSDQ